MRRGCDGSQSKVNNNNNNIKQDAVYCLHIDIYLRMDSTLKLLM